MSSVCVFGGVRVEVCGSALLPSCLYLVRHNNIIREFIYIQKYAFHIQNPKKIYY